MAQALYLVVYGAVLFDIGVRRGDVCLGLVVVVVRDEILHGVLREELAELRAELGGQGLVVREHQRRALDALYDLGHRIGLAGTRDAEQGLLSYPALQARCQRVYGLRLVPRRNIAADYVKIRHDFSFNIH